MPDASQRAARHVLLIATMLVGIGVVMVYSSSSALADKSFENSGFFLQRQLLRAAFGLTIMLLLSRVPLSLWRLLARPLLLVGLLLLVLVLLLGEGRGAQRWLPVGLPSFATLSFQPSELVKLVLVLYLADVLARKQSEISDWKLGLAPRLVVVSVVQVLIVMQPDLGTALAISAISMVILWLGGAGTAHLGLVASGAGLIAVWSVLSSPYQLERVRTFLAPLIDPEGADPQGAGFQVDQALLALGSGGWFGVGLGNSMQKHYLPEPHTDFVFAFAGEELGLLGTLSIICLFAALSVHGYRIATRAASFHGFLVASGITVMVAICALLNVAVATGLMPTTGLPLPFVSYGGSSLLLNLSGIGILAAVAREKVPAASPAWRLRGQLSRPHPPGSDGRWVQPPAPVGSR